MNIELTLKYLLTHPDPLICLIKGQWGVGKTYFVKKFVMKNCSEIAKLNFSYVSLFGISSIDELVQAIFVNSVSTKTLDTTFSGIVSPSSDEALRDRAKYLFDRIKPLLVRAGNLPLLGVNAMRGFALGNLAHFFNRNSLIVIDDLERHSNSLSIRDILGILTNLREERGCQIIIVMNEDALQKDGEDKPYFETKEKVIDREMVFQPTVEDAIEIGLTDKEKNRAAAESCLKLQIGNIRTIQKIGSVLRQLRGLLAEAQVAVPPSFDLQLQTTLMSVFASSRQVNSWLSFKHLFAGSARQGRRHGRHDDG
jgi:Cdc6-like AAA superfamily ATPase